MWVPPEFSKKIEGGLGDTELMEKDENVAETPVESGIVQAFVSGEVSSQGKYYVNVKFGTSDSPSRKALDEILEPGEIEDAVMNHVDNGKRDEVVAKYLDGWNTVMVRMPTSERIEAEMEFTYHGNGSLEVRDIENATKITGPPVQDFPENLFETIADTLEQNSEGYHLVALEHGDLVSEVAAEVDLETGVSEDDRILTGEPAPELTPRDAVVQGKVKDYLREEEDFRLDRDTVRWREADYGMGSSGEVHEVEISDLIRAVELEQYGDARYGQEDPGVQDRKVKAA